MFSTAAWPRAAFCLFALLITCVAAGSYATPVKPCTGGDAGPILGVALAVFASGFKLPVHIAHAGDQRLFVVEQPGTVRLISNGKAAAEPFLDIRDRVESGGEKGLLSVVFHPRFKQNGLFFVDYTTRRDGLRSVISRFRALDGNRADRRSETVLLEIPQPFDNHNGGQLAFGPDGYLYIGMGDGGGANDPLGHGQNTNTLLGALLRIDVDHASPPLRYAIPPNNPFVNKPAHRAEIWAYGLRNPWRFSFDRGSGRLFLADVGQDRVEEIDVITPGGNYGWNIMEGDICTPGVNRNCEKKGLMPPIHSYRHPDGFSVTGGNVYRGREIPGLCGVYVYADYVTGRFWGLRFDGQRVTAQRELLRAAVNASSFGEAVDFEIYVADHQSGNILKLVAGSKPRQ
ncbi:MAG: PQQ-dependent sugar dehydrogenase [Burkholderiales bacterium]